MDVNEGSWSSLASSWGSSKKLGFGGSASCGMLSVRELLARSAKWFRFTGFGWRLVLKGHIIHRRRLWALAQKKTLLVRDLGNGTCHPSKASVGSRAEDVMGQGFGQWDTLSLPCGFGPQSLKLWSACKVKVETVKDQSSHSIKVNHRGPGSRLKVKAIKNKLIQECQSELQEPQSRFKRGMRARS
ncbi:hypothetical protein B0F90DRAFT_1846047 [Multifurca ochricompacta]|uniref:Uncharacterized protein n=1 Tax=Multifurca ochricompacta TaxID=376703 RepID=A0AAD4QJ71_9AGAM|nr:hypothetical protein B0F90DRAFT_1846047 [Multifurca ochricompacta]